MFSTLLGPIDIAGAVITADAVHVQRHTPTPSRRALHPDRQGHQPSLLAKLTDLPRADVPATSSRAKNGHGRREQRSIKVATVAAGIVFPHAARASQITCKTGQLNSRRWYTDTVHGITSIPDGRPDRRRGPRPEIYPAYRW